MKKETIIGGVIGLLVGFAVLVLGVDYLAKPEIVALKFDIVESISTIYFSASFAGGVIGFIIATLFLALCGVFSYWLGGLVSIKIIKNNSEV